MSLSGFGELERRSARQREQSQAVARPARVRYSVRVQGIGETRLTGRAAINFGCYMIEEPTFTSGVVARDELEPGEIPLATAIVLDWKTNDADLYVGAEMGFQVDSGNPDIVLMFSLTFEGVALRTTAPITDAV